MNLLLYMQTSQKSQQLISIPGIMGTVQQRRTK